LVAAAPLYIKAHSEGEFVFDHAWANFAGRLGVSYYPKVLLAVPFTPVTGPRLLTAPGEPRRPLVEALMHSAWALAKGIQASGVHVLFPTEDEANVLGELGFAHRLGSQFHWTDRGYGNLDGFLENLTSKKRHQLRREMAQPSKDGLTLRTLAPHELTPEVRSAMFAFYTSTIEKFFYGRQYLTRAFFDLIVDNFSEHLAWVLATNRAGTPVAGAFNVTDGRRLYGRYWGSSEELPFLHFNVCYYHGIDECLRRGYEAFEPGAGGEHKLARGFLPTLTHSSHRFLSPRLGAPIADYIDEEALLVRRHVLEEAASGPFRAASPPPEQAGPSKSRG
jgi:predicted N-acyltransferase